MDTVAKILLHGSIKIKEEIVVTPVKGVANVGKRRWRFWAGKEKAAALAKYMEYMAKFIMPLMV